ncbi:hypothetical protein WME75_21675 [Sorangium sp. So ce1014]|uniref:hypothetical protein n=1 Tax=Sorangium sp. So ce1014 TaxID=3133326 RepID=UPI003F611742
MALLDDVLAMVGAVRSPAPTEVDRWSVGLPFRATTAQSAPTVPGLTHTLVAGAWENTITKHAPTDQVDLRAPTTGSLHLTTRQGVEQVVIDSAFDLSRILLGFDRSAASDATPLPFIARWTFRGLSLSGFAPRKAVERRLAEMKVRRPAATAAEAAADLLATLRAAPAPALEVFAGEVIGTLDAGPVTLLCELADGSALPLLFVYGALLAGAKAVVSSEAQASSLLKPVLAGPFGLFADFFIPPDGDQHGHLPRGTATGALLLQFEPGPLVELGLLAGQRRIVAARPSGATHATASLHVGTERTAIQVPENGARSQAAAESWRLKLTARTQLTYVAGPPPSIVIEKPVPPIPRTTGAGLLEYVYARLIPPQGAPLPITLEGRVRAPANQGGPIAPGEVTIQLAVDGVSVGSAVTEKGRWRFTLPVDLTLGQRTLTLANGAEIARVLVLDVPLTSLGRAVPSSGRAEARDAWLAEPAEPRVELTPNDAAGDTRDTFALAVTGDPTWLFDTFGVGSYRVSWSATVRTAAPWRDPKFSFKDHPREWYEAWAAKRLGVPEEKWKISYGRWISFQLRTSPARRVRQLFSEPWTPTELELDDRSITATDRAALGLTAKAIWAGNKGKGAGPVCGMALLGGEISRDLEPLAAVLPLEVRVVGYDFWEVRWQTFWDHLRAETARQFVDGYPHQGALGLNGIDLAMLLLALFVKESYFNHFDYTAMLNQYALRPVKDENGKEIEVPHGAEIWGRGPVTMPPPPREMRAQGMPTIAPPTDCGVGQISPPEFRQLVDWRANVAEAVVRLKKPFSRDLKSWAIERERTRLLTTVPAGEKGAAEADLDLQDTKGRLTEFLNGTGVAGAADERGVLTDPRKLLAMLIKLYNGPSLLPYQSNLVWPAGAAGVPRVFAAGGGLAQQENPSNQYARNTLDAFDKIKRNFTPPNHGVGMRNVATIADFMRWCWLQP